MNIFNLIPHKFNLSKKLTALMLIIFLGGIILSSIICYNTILMKVEIDISERADMLISVMDSVRKYNHTKVTPLLQKQSEKEFRKESIPSFAVSGVFNVLTQAYAYKYGEYSYKDAMLNPSNLNDQATDEEVKIIAKLAKQDKLDKKNTVKDFHHEQGFLTVNGTKMFYNARPIKITDRSCLKCHSSLAQAPKSLQIAYEKGIYEAGQGFGWELDKVIGTKIIYIPAAQVYKTSRQNFIFIIGSFILVFAMAIFLANFWLKRYVVRPISRITQIAKAVSLGDMNADFEKQYNDEIGDLVNSFKRMKASLEITLKRLSTKK